jgi:hypothetical protein
LASPVIGQFISLKLATDVIGIFRAKIVGCSCAVASLNDDAFWFDSESGVFFLTGIIVVTWIDTDFHLCIQSSIDFCSNVNKATQCNVRKKAYNTGASGNRSFGREGTNQPTSPTYQKPG